jgi:hypothetical protein
MLRNVARASPRWKMLLAISQTATIRPVEATGGGAVSPVI